ncbi:T9SS type A sorting domain-containing protein [Hymenobacter sp. B81]|uniref:T9SS type A sorting domain-containing protein n=1 Tax=Hymenobacter sp. B81 TaxID=3344878 RepID=UPI0037DDCBBF
MKHRYVPTAALRGGCTALLLAAAASASAQSLNYHPENAQNLAGSYQPIADTTGRVIATANFDDADSAPQNIGFSFPFNGSSFSTFILSSNGFIKLGSAPLSDPYLFFEYAQTEFSVSSGGVTIFPGGPIASTDSRSTNIVAPFATDLMAATGGGTEYRVVTTGTAPNRVCTIEWKNVRDKPKQATSTNTTVIGSQYDNFSFQVKLYETSGLIDFVYGAPTPGAGPDAFRTVAVGIKGDTPQAGDVVMADKNSTGSWANATFIDNYYVGGDPHNVRSSVRPDMGRTYRFRPDAETDATVKAIYTLGQVPVGRQHAVQAVVRNQGTQTLTNLPVTLNVTGQNTFSNTQIVSSLAPGDVTTVTFAAYTAAPLPGNNTVQVSVPADAYAFANSRTLTQAVTRSTLNYVQPIAGSGLVPGSYGYDTRAGVTAVKFTTPTATKVEAVTNFIPTASNSTGRTIYAAVYNAAGSQLARTPDYIVQASDLGTNVTFAFAAPVAIPAGSFFVGIAQPASPVAHYPVGLLVENPVRPGTFYDRPGIDPNGTFNDRAFAGLAPFLIGAVLTPAPVIAAINPDSSLVGATVTITGTNFGGATAVTFNGTPASSFAVDTAGSSISVVVPSGATSGLVRVITPGGTSAGMMFTVIQDLVISSSQNVPAGSYRNITVLDGGVATLTGATTVAGTLQVRSGGTLNTNCQALTGSGSFELQAGGTLGICNAAGITSSGATGAVQLTGTRSFSSDANYLYNGTAAQVTGSGLPTQVRNLTSTNSSVLTLSQPLAIRQVLTLNAGNLSLNARTLTLLSDATGTALIANLGTGAVSGTTVTVQRYIDPTRNPGLGYRHLAAPVTGQTVASFGSGGAALVVNPAYNSSVTPNLVTPFPTIFAYDQARLASSPATTLSAFDKGWVSPTSPGDDAALASRGFTVQLPGASTLSFTGQVGNGSGNIALNRNSGATAADAGWNLIGNPYPSPLDFSTIPAGQRTNVDAAFYTYESTAQYAGQYRSYVNGVGNPLVGTAQAFFMRVSSGRTSGTLSLNNANRVTSYTQQAPVRRGGDTRPLVHLTVQGTGGLTDEAYVYFQAGASAGIDTEYDARKLGNPHGLNLAVAAGGELLAINGLPQLTAETVLPLQVSVPQAGSYTLHAAELLNLAPGTRVLLRDAQTGREIDLQQQASYSFALTGLSAGPRFTLVFRPGNITAASAAQLSALTALYPNPTSRSFTLELPVTARVAGSVAATLCNSLGQVVLQRTLPVGASGVQASFDVSTLPKGVYVLRLQVGEQPISKRVVVE